MLNAIVSISLCSLGYWYWQQAQYCKALALRATKARCYTLELLLLDDYVALTRLGFKKDMFGRWQVYRCYAFEFTSTGEQRYSGVCMLLGHQVQSIDMETYHTESPHPDQSCG
jgi:hypothetical protein